MTLREIAAIRMIQEQSLDRDRFWRTKHTHSKNQRSNRVQSGKVFRVLHDILMVFLKAKSARGMVG